MSSLADSQLAAIVQGSDDAIISTDLDGTVTTWNHGAVVLYGYRADEIIGCNIARVYPDGELSSYERLLAEVKTGKEVPVVEGLRRRRDGVLVPVEVRVSPMLDANGRPIGASAIARDISDRLRRDAELEQSRAFLERTQEIGHIGSWRSETGVDRVLHLSPQCYRILGIDEGRPIRNLDFYYLIHPEDRQLFVEVQLKVRHDQSRSQVEVRLVRPDRSQCWVLIVTDAVVDADGATTGLMGVVQDITERKTSESHLSGTLYDRLTGLPNRSLLLDRAQQALDRARADDTNVAVLFVDLDRFRNWNDTFGHELGDNVLRTVAGRLRELVPVTDTVARVSADEFVVACEGLRGVEVAQRANRVLARVREPVVADHGTMTASVGVAIGGADVTAEALVRDAELAMYQAKQAGGDRYELYDLALRQQAERRLSLEVGLRQALAADELSVEYQPIIALDDGRCTGAEALLRWRSGERGVVDPEEFIGIAEETGLIVAIGRWVLGAACEQLRRWRDTVPAGGDWSISVNVSAAQLRDPDFPEMIERTLAQTGIPGSAIMLELTESLFVEDDAVNEVLRAVHRLGPRISIDDFGTKYSVLSYLTRLPVDEVKIDKSFIDTVAEDPSDRTIVSAIVALGSALGLRVTAEGVSTQAQVDALRDLGCHAAQGFYFSRPVTGENGLTELLDTPGTKG